jgi:hypothetical protein
MGNDIKNVLKEELDFSAWTREKNIEMPYPLLWRMNQKLLKSTDWYIVRHQEELILGEGTSLTDEEFQYLVKNRQALRDNIQLLKSN